MAANMLTRLMTLLAVATAFNLAEVQRYFHPEVATENLARFIDQSMIAVVGIPLRSQGAGFKSKHADYVDALYNQAQGQNPIVAASLMSEEPTSLSAFHFPHVTSVETFVKNNLILQVAIGVTVLCYFTAWFPIFLDNDAGAFFTDCLTMWTMYVYFYKDAKAIQYSYV